jgi:hypothetical protein
MNELPRAGETWERVRDGKRVTVRVVSKVGVGGILHDPHFKRVVFWLHDRFLREFRRVSDGRET